MAQPAGPVKSGGYIPRRFVSPYISTTIHLPFEGYSCILFGKLLHNIDFLM